MFWSGSLAVRGHAEQFEVAGGRVGGGGMADMESRTRQAARACIKASYINDPSLKHESCK